MIQVGDEVRCLLPKLVKRYGDRGIIRSVIKGSRHFWVEFPPAKPTDVKPYTTVIRRVKLQKLSPLELLAETAE